MKKDRRNPMVEVKIQKKGITKGKGNTPSLKISLKIFNK
jgi:hypothetical protein